MNHDYTYQAALSASEKHQWAISDLIGGPKRMDFERAFLPEALARVEPLLFLTPSERRALNQIRGHAYLCMFGLVEEFILPFVLEQARPVVHGDSHRARALLQFASEEAKHIHLFRRFREEFTKGFGTACDVIGPPEAIASTVLSHHPLAVGLLTLHIEWMVQKHWVECTRDNGDIDPVFKDLLKYHWIDESQHTKLDTLMIEQIAAECTPDDIEAAVGQYLEMGGFIDGGLQQQVELDLAAFEKATGRELDTPERATFREVQLRANRFTYIGSGMTHPKFMETLGTLSKTGAERVAAISPIFC